MIRISRRNPGLRGLTYVQANPDGRIVKYTLSSDVMEAARRIERDFPNLRVWWDNENEEHVIVERDSWGNEELVFATKSFHEDLVRARLHRARNDLSDPLDDIDRYNAEVEAEQERQLSERIYEVGEKLAHAFAADGLTVRPRMTPRSVPLRKVNKLQNFDL